MCVKPFLADGRNGGEVVSVHAFYSDDPSSKLTVFSVKFVFESNKNKQKEAGDGQLKTFEADSRLVAYDQKIARTLGI